MTTQKLLHHVLILWSDNVSREKMERGRGRGGGEEEERGKRKEKREKREKGKEGKEIFVPQDKIITSDHRPFFSFFSFFSFSSFSINC